MMEQEKLFHNRIQMSNRKRIQATKLSRDQEFAGNLRIAGGPLGDIREELLQVRRQELPRLNELLADIDARAILLRDQNTKVKLN